MTSHPTIGERNFELNSSTIAGNSLRTAAFRHLSASCASEIGGVADEGLHDVVLALGRVGAHVELDRLLDVGIVGASHGRKAHLLADEAPEVLLVDLAKSLEARDLAAAPALLYRVLSLLVGVAEVVFLLVPDAEEGRFENEDAPVEDELAVEAHEERREEHPDVESVDIGIGREDDLAVAKVLERVEGARACPRCRAS